MHLSPNVNIRRFGIKEAGATISFLCLESINIIHMITCDHLWAAAMHDSHQYGMQFSPGRGLLIPRDRAIECLLDKHFRKLLAQHVLSHAMCSLQNSLQV